MFISNTVFLNLRELVDEIQKFDAKDAQNTDALEKRTVQDLRKTSMYKGVQVFKEFLRKLKEKLDINSGSTGNFNLLSFLTSLMIFEPGPMELLWRFLWPSAAVVHLEFHPIIFF